MVDGILKDVPNDVVRCFKVVDFETISQFFWDQKNCNMHTSSKLFNSTVRKWLSRKTIMQLLAVWFYLRTGMEWTDSLSNHPMVKPLVEQLRRCEDKYKPRLN